MDAKKYNSWQTDLSLTQPALDIIKEKIFKNGELVSIEESKNETLIWFDRYAGIDWIGKNENNHLICIAARIQWDNAWNTFTIRYKRKSGSKTEYEKRKEAIEKGYLYPQFTLQAYFKKENFVFLSGALIRTKDLFDAIDKYGKTRSSDNVFIFISFKELKDRGYKVYNL